MKRITASTVEILKIVIHCITIPLYFVKLFCDEAVLPGFNQSGEEIISTSYYYYSIFDKIDREGITYLLWGAVAITIASIAFAVLNIAIKDKKAIKIASHIVFGVAIVLFFVLLFIAWSIQYSY